MIESKIFFENDHSKQVATRSCYKFSLSNILITFAIMNSLKIPNGHSEAVNRMTSNVQKDKRTNNHLPNTTENKSLSNTHPTKNPDECRCAGRVSSSYSTYETRRVTVKWQEHNLMWNCLNNTVINVSTDQMWVCGYLFRRIMTAHNI